VRPDLEPRVRPAAVRAQAQPAGAVAPARAAAGADAEPGQGRAPVQLPVRGRRGAGGARRAGGDGPPAGGAVRLVRRGRAVAPAGPAFGQRVIGLFAEEGSV
ncbi:MAG: hypothetical protein AVDCRST_MAG64-1737, partial [uncultured Phycisphaerae bacterium]